MPQIAEGELSNEIGRLTNGRFGSGNNICNKSTRGRGYAKPTIRLANLLEESTIEEVRKTMQSPDFVKKKAMDGVVYNRAIAALDGDADAINFVFDRIEGKAVNKTELTGANGGPLAVATADVTPMIADVLEKIEE